MSETESAPARTDAERGSGFGISRTATIDGSASLVFRFDR